MRSKDYAKSSEKLSGMSEKPKTRKRRSPRKIKQSYLENAGLYYLERYSSSAANFRRVMRRKISRSAKFHENTAEEIEEFHETLEKIIARYQESGLLNDSMYAFSKVRSMRGRGHSRRKIQAKLYEKGLTSDQIDAALSEYNDDMDESAKTVEMTAAEKYARKKRLGPYRQPYDDDADLYRKDMGKMARAGFSYDVVKTVLENSQT